MKHFRPPHLFLPDDEQRNCAIQVLAVSRNDKATSMPPRTILQHHVADYWRRGVDVVDIVYTPNNSKNCQSCDRVSLGVVR